MEWMGWVGEGYLASSSRGLLPRQSKAGEPSAEPLFADCPLATLFARFDVVVFARMRHVSSRAHVSYTRGKIDVIPAPAGMPTIFPLPHTHYEKVLFVITCVVMWPVILDYLRTTRRMYV